MKPADLLKQAEILTAYIKTCGWFFIPNHIRDTIQNIDDFGDEVYNHLQDEAQGDAP